MVTGMLLEVDTPVAAVVGWGTSVWVDNDNDVFGSRRLFEV